MDIWSLWIEFYINLYEMRTDMETTSNTAERGSDSSPEKLSKVGKFVIPIVLKVEVSCLSNKEQ